MLYLGLKTLEPNFCMILLFDIFIYLCILNLIQFYLPAWYSIYNSFLQTAAHTRCVRGEAECSVA